MPALARLLLATILVACGNPGADPDAPPDVDAGSTSDATASDATPDAHVPDATTAGRLAVIELWRAPGAPVTAPWTPAFDPATTAYTVDVALPVASVQVSATPVDSATTLTIAGTPTDAGVLSAPIPLAFGSNEIIVTGTAPGGAQVSYTIDVRRSVSRYLKASTSGAWDFFGIRLALSGTTLAVSSPGEDSNAPGVNGDQTNNLAGDSGAVYVFEWTGGNWTQQAYIKASNPALRDYFGREIALAGDTLAIAATGEDSNATGIDGDQSNDLAEDSGAVYVFTRTGGTWSQQAYIKASNTDRRDGFGTAIALDGDTLAVGADYEASAATGIDGDQTSNAAERSGAVYVFARTGTTWVQQAYVKSANSEEFDYFGTSVALSGDTLAVGAYQEDGSVAGVDGDQSDNGTEDAGAAYVFTRTSGSWSQTAYLKASNPGAYDHYGMTIVLDGDTVVVGARDEDSPATGIDGAQNSDAAWDSGAAYVYVRTGATWAQQAYVKASNTVISAFFSDGMALAGDRLVIGAPWDNSDAVGIDGDQTDASAVMAGAAYVFERTGAVWSQRAYVKASNTDPDDRFGVGVAISPTLVVVGAMGEDGASSGINGNQASNGKRFAGAVYTFPGTISGTAQP